MLCHGTSFRGFEDSTPVTAFADAPSLSRVALGTTVLPNGKAAFILPWNQLTHFRDADRQDIWPALSSQHCIAQSPNLQWLGFTVRQKDTYAQPTRDRERDDGLGSRAIAMECLNTLSLNIAGMGYLQGIEYPDFLEMVELPNLRTLRFTARVVLDGPGSHQNRFMAKLQMLRKLEFLSLCVEEIDTHPLKSLLSCVSPVHVLHFSTRGSYNRLFQLLETSELLPHLDTLILESGPDLEGSSERRPLQMLRQNKINPLFLHRLLNTRKAGFHPTSRIRRIILWGKRPADVNDSQVLRVIESFMKKNREGNSDLVLDRRVRRMEVGKEAAWMEMDPRSCEWEEAWMAEHFSRRFASTGDDWSSDSDS